MTTGLTTRQGTRLTNAGIYSLEKENLNAMGRSSCENSFVLTKPKLHNENATLRILLCYSQSDLHVIY